MITLHHLNNSRSQRILWLLEELEIPYDIKRYQRNKVTMLAPPELKAVHPLGKSPLISDGAKIIAESANIIEYLLDHYGQGRLRPKADTDEFLQYRFWLHYAEGSLMPPLLLALVFQKVETGPMPFFVKPIAKGISAEVKKAFITPQINLHLDYMESVLNKQEWFAGNQMTAADIMLSFPLEAASARGFLKERPKLHLFLQKIHARPAYQKALQQGGEYQLGF